MKVGEAGQDPIMEGPLGHTKEAEPLVGSGLHHTETTSYSEGKAFWGSPRGQVRGRASLYADSLCKNVTYERSQRTERYIVRRTDRDTQVQRSQGT